jgi:tetratricopeptide (TPR) repeat protein
MASSLAVSLSNTYIEWSNLFKLQNSCKFNEALHALSSVPKNTLTDTIFSRIIEANLIICIGAIEGSLPTANTGDSIRQMVKEAHDASIDSLAIEGLLLLFDCFPSSRDETIAELSNLEDTMDDNTKRRWIHRKGNYLISSGFSEEAFELWSTHVQSICDQRDDSDDSMVALLVDFGRLASQLGKYSDAVEIYNQAVCLSQTPYNQCVSLIRLANALERISRPAQADKRRVEFFNIIGKEYPTQCSLCSGLFGKEPKFLIPCCKTITHSECLRAVVSEYQGDATDCPFCQTKFLISDVADPTAISARKYKRHKKPSEGSSARLGSEIVNQE